MRLTEKTQTLQSKTLKSFELYYLLNTNFKNHYFVGDHLFLLLLQVVNINISIKNSTETALNFTTFYGDRILFQKSREHNLL